MILAIMTRGRVGRQETLKWIPSKWRDKTVVVCPEEEENGHTRFFPWVEEVMPPKHWGINNYSRKFQALYDGTLLSEEDKVVIMDDDLYFNEYIDGRLCVIKDPERVAPMFDLMEAMLDKIPLVGVHPRLMAQNAKPPFEWNSKIVTIQGINRSLCPRGLVLDKHPILADVRLNCELLSRGLPTARITTHFVDWLPSQSAGGCDYRTAEMQRLACEDIARDFAPFASVVTKKPKTAKWLGDERTDLKVRWKDLYNASPKRIDVLDKGTGNGAEEEGGRTPETVE
jgi:hypothetical protein